MEFLYQRNQRETTVKKPTVLQLSKAKGILQTYIVLSKVLSQPWRRRVAVSKVKFERKIGKISASLTQTIPYRYSFQIATPLFIGLSTASYPTDRTWDIEPN